MRSAHRACCAAAIASLLWASAGAHAQGLALDRFDPAPAGDRMFGVPSPFVAGALTPHIGVLMDYAHNPLVLRRAPDGTRARSVVSSQLFVHLNASLALWNLVLINID